MEAVAAVPVAKRWQRTPEGRTVLFEAVEYASLAPLLAQVPASTTEPARLEQRRLLASAQRHLPIHKSEVINPKSTGPTTRGTEQWGQVTISDKWIGVDDLEAMARKLRVVVAGGGYHVMNRGHRQEAIFRTDTDRRRFFVCLR